MAEGAPESGHARGAAAPCGLLSDVAIGHAWGENESECGVETVRVRAKRLDGVGAAREREVLGIDRFEALVLQRE